MTISELFRNINNMRLKIDQEPVTAERFLEELTVMQVLGKIEIINNEVFNVEQ